MAKAYEHMPMAQRIVYFGKSRIHEIEEQIQSLRQEAIMWAELIDQQGLCLQCDGKGQLRVQIAQDESTLETCDRCKGTGKRP